MPFDKDVTFTGSVPLLFAPAKDKSTGESVIAALRQTGTTGELGTRVHHDNTRFKHVADKKTR